MSTLRAEGTRRFCHRAATAGTEVAFSMRPRSPHPVMACLPAAHAAWWPRDPSFHTHANARKTAA
jgi:hypothetical protein